ncbi:hypothetical protein GCM10010385_59900 [Streptomyces geysiriensis]|nr:hypothetical protein GCM10010385_59900 [Streptomyces geysiriensis]
MLEALPPGVEPVAPRKGIRPELRRGQHWPPSPSYTRVRVSISKDSNGPGPGVSHGETDFPEHKTPEIVALPMFRT